MVDYNKDTEYVRRLVQKSSDPEITRLLIDHEIKLSGNEAYDEWALTIARSNYISSQPVSTKSSNYFGSCSPNPSSVGRGLSDDTSAKEEPGQTLRLDKLEHTIITFVSENADKLHQDDYTIQEVLYDDFEVKLIKFLKESSSEGYSQQKRSGFIYSDFEHQLISMIRVYRNYRNQYDYKGRLPYVNSAQKELIRAIRRV